MKDQRLATAKAHLEGLKRQRSRISDTTQQGRNAREHLREQIGTLRKSIEAYEKQQAEKAILLKAAKQNGLAR